jgi:hypothetical protein
MLERRLERLWMVDAGGRHGVGVGSAGVGGGRVGRGTCLYTVHASLFQCKEPLMSSPNLLSSRSLRGFPLSLSLASSVITPAALLLLRTSPCPSSNPSSSAPSSAPASSPGEHPDSSPPAIAHPPPASGSSPASDGARPPPPRSARPSLTTPGTATQLSVRLLAPSKLSPNLLLPDMVRPGSSSALANQSP